MAILEEFHSALEKGLTKAIFDHIRNYLMCAFLLAIGTAELKHQTSQVFGFVPSTYSGSGIIGVATILILLNLYNGIRKISVSRFHFFFTIGLISLYIFVSFRVVELTWNFRIAL